MKVQKDSNTNDNLEQEIYLRAGKIENGIIYFGEDSDCSGVIFKSDAAYNEKEGICYIPNYATITAIIGGEEVELELSCEDDLETLKNGIPMEDIISISDSYTYGDYIKLATGDREGSLPNEELARTIFESSGSVVNEPGYYFQDFACADCLNCGYAFKLEEDDNMKGLPTPCPKCGTVHDPRA